MSDDLGDSGAEPPDLAPMFEAFLEASRGILNLASLPSAMPRVSAQTEVDPLAVTFLFRIGLIAMTSGLRSVGRLASICDEHRGPLAGAALTDSPPMSADQKRLLIEQLRRLARDLGETAVREAGRFRADLDRLALGLDADPACSRSQPAL